MRYLPIELVEEGMTLANAIYDMSGRVLVGVKKQLSATYIEKLKDYGFSGLYIEDELSEGIEVESIISPQLRMEGMNAIKRLDVGKCLEVSQNIVDDIMAKEFVSVDMLDLRSYDDHTYAHSVNVAVLSGVIGMGMDMKRKELENMVLAALLHDLGKLQIADEILNKPGRLTAEEYEVMKTHSTLSYELIKDRFELSAEVKVAVLFHHENVDGSGYPKGIAGDEQTLFTKILHVADVFDALVSKRPYKKPYSSYEACEYLMGGCGIMFDLKCVQTLMKYVPMYPKGTEVALTDGRRGIIFENSGVYNMRPIIRLLDGELLDLSTRENLNIGIIAPNSELLGNPEDEKITRSGVSRPLIYVVDDMHTNQELLKNILQDTYEVECFSSGEAALLALERNNWPRLVLMDVDMPGMDGIQTTERILDMTNRAVPVLFVSSLSDRETVICCKRLNVQGYILRPYNDIYIRDEIARILTGRSES